MEVTSITSGSASADGGRDVAAQPSSLYRSAVEHSVALADSAARGSLDRLDRAVGGPARRQVVVVLALVLALDSADQATVGASATQLRRAFSLSNTDIGLLIAVTGLVGAAATLPFGVLVDRINRTRMIAAVTLTWVAAMVMCASATSFRFLLVTRAALGAVTAVAVPGVASLIGDWFHPRERGRIYGFVLSGELIGAGFGFTIAGGLAALSWRASFLVLAAPAVFIASLMWRLPEPQRGGATQLRPGLVSLEEAARRSPDGRTSPTDGAVPLSDAQRQAKRDHVRPGSSTAGLTDPASWSLPQALRYVVSIRSNVTLIIAGTFGYFFFAGVRAFGVEFVKGQYGVGQAVASLLTLILGAAAIVGVVVGGTVSDWLTNRGRVSGRLTVGGVALALAAVCFIPALRTHNLAVAVAALSAAGFALAAVNPPLDAARLDIVPPVLWGRAEAARTLLREPAQALAPLIFGVLADHTFGGGQTGLDEAFLIMLVPLLAGAIILVRGRRHYAGDLATTVALIEHHNPRDRDGS
jgi:MFS family permease